MTEESRLIEIELYLQSLSRDLRLKRRNLKAQGERARRPFTKYQTEFALRVYCLSQYNMDAAATCLHNLCQRRQEHLSEVEQRQELIESQFLKVCPSIAAEMSVWATTPGSTCARSAQKAYLEYTVMKWVQTENVMHGHAPSTDLIMEYRRHLAGQWERPSSGLSTLEPAADLHSHEHTTNRCWAARFRLRWGGRMARIRLREPMAEEVALQKAARRIHKMQSTGRSLWDPFWQAKRAQNGAYATEMFM